MYCNKCNIYIVDGSNYCNLCGGITIENKVQCPHSEFNPHMCNVWDKFCGTCGKPVQQEMKDILSKEGGGKEKASK